MKTDFFFFKFRSCMVNSYPHVKSGTNNLTVNHEMIWPEIAVSA